MKNKSGSILFRHTISIKLLFNLIILLLMVADKEYMANAAAVMSVDLGTEWVKVGVVSPGVPMEIALNRESKRKTPAILAFRDGMRSFGEDAVTAGIKDPSSAYGYLLDLLGKKLDNPIVDLYRKRFPYYDIIEDSELKTIVFKKSETEQFSVEELLAQMLVKAKEYAQEFTNQLITECVLTVPGYFGQAERKALLIAAQLANLKVLQLINDYTAVALNYGVFHRGNINETAQYYIFYDMGAYKTSAALVSYQLVKDKQTKEINPVVQVLGVGIDRTLGGLEIQLRLRDYLAVEFNAMKKTKTDVTNNPKALAKLFKEAGRVKNVLSANNDHYAQIENLIDDQDFKLQVTREKLEELCVDLWPRVTRPIEEAVTASGLSLDLVSQVILFGGGTRVPRVQEIIKQAIHQEPGKSLNADEAATMGAVYKAADLATGFKVKKFIIKDAVLYPIQVTFERENPDENSSGNIKRILFGTMNSYPQKKVITFNKHTHDFDFNVHYGNLSHLSQQEISYIREMNIMKIELLKVKDVLEKNKQEIIDSKGIKAYFVLDESGIFQCTGVDYVYEKRKATQTDGEGTLAKLGSTISKLFSKDSEKKTLRDENSNDKENEDVSKSHEDKQEQPSKDDEQVNVNKTTEDLSGENKTHYEKGDVVKNDTIEIVIVKDPIEYKLTELFTNSVNGHSFEKSLEKLTAINNAETERARLESAFNALEAHIVDIQQKLLEDEYISCITEDEKSKILLQCESISDWLYEDHENPTPNMYEKRLNDLKKLTNVLMSQHFEHEERPGALKALDSVIDGAKKFLTNAINFTKDSNPDKDIFTQVEIESLKKVIDETIEWKTNEENAQNKLKRHETIRLTVKDINNKMSLIDREVQYMLNKIKIWKPKIKSTKKSGENKVNETKAEVNEEHEEEDGDTLAELDNTMYNSTNTTFESPTPRSDL